MTISTNMAGRGTDILLGGNPEYLAKHEAGAAPAPDAPAEELISWKEKLETITKKWIANAEQERAEVIRAGGLYIIGTERHESRRIDNQLRGRAGRQGDPGQSKFYLSLDDDLMRIFGGVNIKRFMEDDLPIEHPWITKAIANAQRKVEAHNYDIRKHLLEYDDVMNQQRKVVYAWRKEVLSQKNLREMIFWMTEEIIAAICEDFFPGGKPKKGDGPGLDTKELNEAIGVTFQVHAQVTENDIVPFNGEGLKKLLTTIATKAYDAKEAQYSAELVRQVEKMVLLGTIDQLWKDHLLAMDHLRDGIGLQGYGQKDPLVEYKKQGFKFFEMMMHQITGDVVRKLFAVQITAGQNPEELEDEFEPEEIREAPVKGAVKTLAPAAGEAPAQRSLSPSGAPSPMRSQAPLLKPLPLGIDVSKLGRNDVCPCGSGKKYKKCHGQ